MNAKFLKPLRIRLSATDLSCTIHLNSVDPLVTPLRCFRNSSVVQGWSVCIVWCDYVLAELCRAKIGVSFLTYNVLTLPCTSLRHMSHTSLFPLTRISGLSRTLLYCTYLHCKTSKYIPADSYWIQTHCVILWREEHHNGQWHAQRSSLQTLFQGHHGERNCRTGKGGCDLPLNWWHCLVWEVSYNSCKRSGNHIKRDNFLWADNRKIPIATKQVILQEKLSKQ